MNWFYKNNDAEVGPFDHETLMKLSAAGVINESTPVRADDATEWSVWSEVAVSGAAASVDEPPPVPALTARDEPPSVPDFPPVPPLQPCSQDQNGTQFIICLYPYPAWFAREYDQVTLEIGDVWFKFSSDSEMVGVKPHGSNGWNKIRRIPNPWGVWIPNPWGYLAALLSNYYFFMIPPKEPFWKASCRIGSRQKRRIEIDVPHQRSGRLKRMTFDALDENTAGIIYQALNKKS